jgi:hypothetical protein
MKVFKNHILPVLALFGIAAVGLSILLPKVSPPVTLGSPAIPADAERPEVTEIPRVGYLFGFHLKGDKVKGYIDFDKEGDQNHRLLFWENKLVLQWVTPQKKWPITEVALPDLSEGTTMRVMRRNGRIIVLKDDKVLLAADGLGLGRDANPSVAFDPVAVELTAPIHRRMGNIYFSDDFMRDRVAGVWTPRSGAWEISSTSFASNGANPFSLYSRGEGSPKVDDIHQGRPGQEFVGIGIQLTPAIRTRYLNIVRVTGNSPAAEAGIKVRDQIAEINGESVRRAKDEDPGTHWQRTYAKLQGNEGEDLALTILSRGQEREVILKRRQLKWGQIDKRIKIKPYEISETSLITTGPAFWDQFHFECSVKARLQGAVGLAFHVRDKQNYRVLRWWGDNKGGGPHHQLELVKVVDGIETVLATAAKPGGPYPFQYYKLGIEVGPNFVVGKIDRKQMLRADLDDLSFGSVGLYTNATDGVFFDDVIVSNTYQDIVQKTRPDLPKAMIDDGAMAPWVGLSNLWIAQLTTGVRWHDFEFPGDVQIKLDEMPKKVTRLIIAGDGTLLSRGYILYIEPQLRQLTLFKDKLKKATEVLPVGQILPLIFRREGNRLIASSNKKKLIDWEDKEPLKRTRLGVQMSNLQSVEVSPLSYWDYTFTDAPTDWEIAGGHWGTMNRWICDPRWSWFGGKSRSVAALWHKNKFQGDIIFDAYVGLMMVRETPPLERAADIGMTIFGDGKSLYSGYTMILAGDNNSWTRLYRNGENVASTSEQAFLLPADYRNNRTLEQIHRRWVHVQMVKRGNVIECYYQDRLALQFEDNNPISEGRIALWTVNNGFVISRARILDANAPGQHIPLRTHARYEDEHISNWVSNELSTGIERTKAGEYKVTNLLSGGTFGVKLKPEKLAGVKRAVLKFKAKFEPGANVDLYFERSISQIQIDPGKRNIARASKFGLTGPAEAMAILQIGYEPQRIVVIGSAPAEIFVGDWQQLSIDFTPHLQGNHVIKNIVIGNYSNSDYLLAGFSGNKKGATFYLKDIEWEFGGP